VANCQLLSWDERGNCPKRGTCLPYGVGGNAKYGKGKKYRVAKAFFIFSFGLFLMASIISNVVKAELSDRQALRADSAMSKHGRVFIFFLS